MGTLALDIGATKIALGHLDSSHTVIKRDQVASNIHNPIWPELARAIAEFTAGLNIERIGIASAGPIDRNNGTISPVNIAQWRNFPIVHELASLFPNRQIRLLGDCTAVALAENKLGAGVGTSNMFAVVVSTGIGGGLVIDGRAFHGDTGNAALFGHHSIGFESNVRCDCGRVGCLETFARGPKMVEHAISLGWNGGSDFIALAQSAREADPRAITAINRGAHALAVGITNVLNVMDLHTVVIGGGVSFAGDIFWKPFLHHFAAERKFAGFLDEVRVLPAAFQADAGLIGASLFASDSQS